MSGIHVLSDILKGGNKLERTPTPKGKDVSDSPENVAAVFVTMLSGFMNLNSKGQISQAGQELEVKQSAKDPIQSTEIPNGLGSMLGYDNFALSNLFQPMLQSDLPAGKEANSGNDVSQGSGGLATANAVLTNVPIISGNNFELVTLNVSPLVSDEVFTSTGMTTSNPQGANPEIMELDKYRQVISELLVALSGKITDLSPEGAPLVLERGTSERQEMMKLVQSWLTVTDDVVNNVQVAPSAQTIGGQSNNGQVFGNLEKYIPVDFGTVVDQLHSENLNSISSSRGVEDLRQVMARMTPMTFPEVGVSRVDENELFAGQKVIKRLIDFLTEQGTVSRELNTKASSLRVILNQILSQIQEKNVPQGVIKEMLPTKSDRIETFFNQPRSSSHVLETAAAAGNDAFLQTNFKQKLAGVDLVNSNPLKTVQGITSEESSKVVLTEDSGLTGVKTSLDQNPSLGIGSVRNITTGNVADGKTVAIPVWEQISNVLRQQVTNRHQELKELDIQLHPADLGKIKIGMRWENGQVHLVVQASEAATGQLLQNQLSDLRQNLTNQGVNCGMLQMGQSGERQQNSRGDESQRTFNQNTDPNEEEDQSTVSNSLFLGQDRINRINVTA